MAVSSSASKQHIMTLSRRILSILVLNLFALGMWAQETGKADIFSDEFQGSWTASQSTYNKDEFVAAHKSYEFGTILKVEVAGQDRAVNVRVVDRGPFKHGYIMTLSRAAATELGYKEDDQRDVTIFVAREQGLAVTPQAAVPNTTSIVTAPVQAVVTTPTHTQVVTTIQQPSATNTTIVETREEFSSKGQVANVEIGTEYTPIITKPTETIVTTNVTTAAPRIMTSNLGYGLQVGSFIDYNNAMNEMSKLQNTNISNLLLNSIVDDKGRTVYKLIIGPYSDRVEVEQYKVLAPQKYNNKAFIVDLSKMK